MSHLPTATQAVALGAPLPVHINNGQHEPSFSQAPTLAPSSSSFSSTDEKRAHSHKANGYATSGDPEKNAGRGYEAEPTEVDDVNTADMHHVDVEKAKAEFNALERRMSERSSLHRARSRASQANSSTADVEKQDEDEWNLLDYMTGNAASRETQGFRHKEIGVVWDHLKVIGGGGMSELITGPLSIYSNHDS
jgi:beta-mannanase